MPKHKVSKTITERFKITSRGKVLHLSGGIKHRRSKERTSLRMRGKGMNPISPADKRRLRHVLGI
ncbi:MAG: 50S ribosomal protein L35 [Patescibacteria group bacterium]